MQAWLTTAFLSIAMPVPREADLLSSESRPLTLHAFLELCHHVTNHLDYAPHLIAVLLEVSRGLRVGVGVRVRYGSQGQVALSPNTTTWTSPRTPNPPGREHYARRAPHGRGTSGRIAVARIPILALPQNPKTPKPQNPVNSLRA